MCIGRPGPLLFDSRLISLRGGQHAQQYGRRPQRFGVEGVLAQTHTPEESHCCEMMLLPTSDTISKDSGCNNPQMGDFVLPVKQPHSILEEAAQVVALLLRATCPETGDAPDVLSSRASWPKPTPRRNQLLMRCFCVHVVLHLMSDTISKSRGCNNPQMGDFLNEVLSTLLRFDHIVDLHRRQVRQSAQQGDH
jgi:hypothetical protein